MEDVVEKSIKCVDNIVLIFLSIVVKLWGVVFIFVKKLMVLKSFLKVKKSGFKSGK